MEQSPPQEYDTLIDTTASRHEHLSKRLKQIATFALEHPTTMGIETIANIAQNAEVQPSALIRFAKNFGYSGFSEVICNGSFNAMSPNSRKAIKNESPGN